MDRWEFPSVLFGFFTGIARYLGRSMLESFHGHTQADFLLVGMVPLEPFPYPKREWMNHIPFL